MPRGFLNCDSEKVLYLLKCEVCGEAPCVVKAKPNFATGSTVTKVNIEHSEKVSSYKVNITTIVSFVNFLICSFAFHL